jgi:hypothetical protein
MVKMRLFRFLAFLAVFPIAVAWGDPFSDDFERADGDDVGNDWRELEDDGIEVSIEDGEVKIDGTQDVDWERNGIERDVEDVLSVYFDFLANASFNVHIRIDDTTMGSYIDIYAPPGGAFNYASSPDGGWPGWTQIPGSNMMAGQYNTLGVEQEGEIFTVFLNGDEVGEIENKNLIEITKLLIASDSAVGTVGVLYIDNVIIGDPEGGGQQPVDPIGKTAIHWGEVKGY